MFFLYIHRNQNKQTMTKLMNQIIDVVKMFQGNITKDWEISESLENDLGVSFILETPKFLGHITIIPVPNNPHLAVYIHCNKQGEKVSGKTTIVDTDLIRLLNDLDNKEGVGHRAPSDTLQPTAGYSRPERFRF